MTKSRGERGSPCLTPLLQLKDFPGTPLCRMEEVLVCRMVLIHWIHFCGNPFFCSMSKIVLCSTISNVFSKSSFRMTISFLEW
uniref:Uncharacterized protein n=1 Tax=Arundo donax TaxID=35708 RepID=A0A0A9G5N5_ARUDO